MLLFPSLVFLASVACWFLKPDIVQYVFLANLWLLSYPHTFATFTRSYFSIKENKFKAGVCVVGFLVFNLWVLHYYDFVMLINIYFYTQFFHYVRQNFGISKLGSKSWNVLDTVCFHVFHIALLLFFFRHDHSFLGYKLFQPDLDTLYSNIGAGVIIIIGCYFLVRIKTINKLIYLYLGLGTLMTYNETSFILGWLGLHLFHNSQYISMNWKLNPRESFGYHYVKIVVLVFVVYRAAYYFETQLVNGLSIAFCLILAVNYSHYLFDSYLWKRHFRLYYP
jgi:hypothetical protein